jgi:hypothetical protein
VLNARVTVNDAEWRSVLGSDGKLVLTEAIAPVGTDPTLR